MHKKFTKGLAPRARSGFSGFTLIELLVVIAIIGILASIVLVSLNQARARSRDAARVTSLQQMGQFISVNDTDPASFFWTIPGDPTGLPACISAYCDVPDDINGPISMGREASTSLVTNFGSYIDPTAGTTSPACVGDTGGSPTTLGTPCDYSLSYVNNDTPVGSAAGNPDSQHFELCAMLEGSIGGNPAGLIHVGSDTGGSVAAGCY